MRARNPSSAGAVLDAMLGREAFLCAGGGPRAGLLDALFIVEGLRARPVFVGALARLGGLFGPVDAMPALLGVFRGGVVPVAALELEEAVWAVRDAGR